MPHLLDVNVLLALAWPSHEHHISARQWFAERDEDGWATCPITQNGFVRLSSNKLVTPDAVSPKHAVALLAEMISDPMHLFWPDDLMLTDSRIAHAKLRGHRQITDAYLLGLAIHRGGHLATFDSGIKSLARTKAEEALIDVIQLTRP